MRSAATRIVPSCLIQAQRPIYRQADLKGIGVFLPIVLPPANRT